MEELATKRSEVRQRRFVDESAAPFSGPNPAFIRRFFFREAKGAGLAYLSPPIHLSLFRRPRFRIDGRGQGDFIERG